ncbi:MAG: hypothetical protein K2M56_00855 [Muribaculaceae bacterium]|nr:hypothetical protein [Muribaculaceae bacterium]
MDLSPEDKLKMAPILAKYTIPSTEAYITAIKAINKFGIGILHPDSLLALSINLDAVPEIEIQNIKKYEEI